MQAVMAADCSRQLVLVDSIAADIVVDLRRPVGSEVADTHAGLDADRTVRGPAEADTAEDKCCRMLGQGTVAADS
jgi:hypothetical protein